MSTTLDLTPLCEALRLGDRLAFIGRLRDLLGQFQGFDPEALTGWIDRLKGAIEWLRGENGQAAYGYLRTILAFFGVELPDTLPLWAQSEEWSDDALVAQLCGAEGVEAQSLGSGLVLIRLVLELLKALRAKA